MKSKVQIYRDLTTSIILAVLLACSNDSSPHILGIWQGPHPENDYATFIFNIDDQALADSSFKGYWLIRNQYNSHFSGRILFYETDSISLDLPEWGCGFAGKMSADPSRLSGSITCEGEDPDKISLTRVLKRDIYGVFQDSPDPNTPEPLISIIPRVNLPALHDLITAIKQGQYGEIHSLLIADKDSVYYESYFKGYGREVLHPIESANKSITALLVAMAIHHEVITSDELLVKDLIPEPYRGVIPDEHPLRLSDVLGMTAGYAPDDWALLMAEDRELWALSREPTSSPGVEWNYDGGCPVILGLVIRSVTGMPLDQYAEETLFKELGIRDYDWDLFRQKGNPLPSGSLWLKPIDLLKIGQLVLGDGAYQGAQIIDQDLIQKYTSPLVATGIDNDFYGYQWWVSEFGKGERHHRMIWANGLGSQFILIFPDDELVIVTTGANQSGGNDADSWTIIKGIQELLLRGEELKEDPPENARIY
ncbi:MAG: beta-lactamase family protein [Candidatus Marinimicrobia bacterium]|nr:beta-lactamase family protein [Candidatus Neomarinimicrobiota bacterium]